MLLVSPRRISLRSILRWLALAWFALCCVGHVSSSGPSAQQTPGPSVRLMRASLPSALGWIAQHYWFAIRTEGEDFRRWEVWQTADQGGESWGHVHKSLFAWDSGVGGGDAELVHEWRGSQARDFARCLTQAGPTYEHRNTYRAWPGPNSNTFVEAMLRECDLPWTLDGTGIGKDYRGIVGASMSSGQLGVQAETPLVGILLGLDEGIQVHALSLTFGIDVWPPAILTPFGDGRFGFFE